MSLPKNMFKERDSVHFTDGKTKAPILYFFINYNQGWAWV